MKAVLIRSLVVAVAVSVVTAGSVQAQEHRSLAEQPMLILRENGLDARSVTDYLTSLANELQVGRQLVEQISASTVQEASPRRDRPAGGTMYFMVRGLVPDVEVIHFIQVADEEDFERLMRLEDNSGSSSTFEGANGQFTKTETLKWREPLTEDAEPTADSEGVGGAAADPPKNSVVIAVGLNSQPGPLLKVTTDSGEAVPGGTLVEENGRRFREHVVTTEKYFRYHDGFMFTSSFRDLNSLPLPSRESLLGRSESGLDAELEFFPDRIPVGFKHLFWNTIQSGVGTGLQQVDGEDPVDYTLRRSAGDVGLTILQTLLFDTEQVRGQFSLAKDDQPIRGELVLRSRSNSNFAKDLGSLTTARSRFAPLLNDAAAVTVHTSLKLPENAGKVIAAAGHWMKARLPDAAGIGANADLAISGDELNRTMEGISGHGNLELLLKVGWTKSSDGVLYGGLQVDENPQLLSAIYRLLVADDRDSKFRDRFTLVEKNDLPMIEFRAPPDPHSPLRISHVFIAHQNACLWFAAGSANAHEILHHSIVRCGEAGMRAKTPLLTARIDLQRWMSYPQDDPTGIASLPAQLDAGLTNKSLSTIAESGVFDTSQRVVPANFTKDALLQAVVRMGGSRKASLVLDAEESVFVARTEIGAVIGRYVIARFLDMMDRETNGDEPQGIVPLVQPAIPESE